MAELKSKETVMAGLQFEPDEKHRNLVRVQMKDFAGVLKVLKWNYKARRWGKWAKL